MLLTVGLVYLLSRLCFYDLAIALDQPRPFRTSWNLSKGNVWRLFGLMILNYIPFFVSNVLGRPLCAAMITQSFSSVYRDLTGEKPR